MSVAQQPRIPGLIRRNTLLLAVTQAFTGAGSQLVPTLGGIMIERLLGSMALAGLATSIVYVARLVIAYPIGWVMDRYGRRAGLFIGIGLGLVGALAIGWAMLASSFVLFVAAMFLFGLGFGATQQLRTAAADMYLPERRAEGLGLVLTGSLIGAFGGPLIVTVAQAAAGPLAIDETALAWFLVPGVLLPGVLAVVLIRPDPRTIASDLARFYPGYREPVDAVERTLAAGAGVGAWLAHYPLRVAFAAMFVAHGVMAMMMALTPLAMSMHGSPLTLISLAVSLHVVGMYGLSLPFGRAADRLGRKTVIVGGLAVVAAGALLVGVTADYVLGTVGLVLVGLGWSGVNVAVTALVADAVPALERSRAVGVVDSFSGLASITLPLVGGVLAEAYGFPALGVLSVALVVVATAFALRLDERAPGHYAEAAT